MKLNLRAGVAIGCALSFAGGLVQLSACATGQLEESADAAPDVIFRPRPTTPSDASGPASACDASPCVLSIALGGAHSCALIADGTVRCWGDNYAGELGSSPEGGTVDGSATAILQSETPIVAGAVNGVVGVVGGGPFSSPSLDNDVTCAMTATAPPQCWGSNQYSMLGRGAALPADTNPHPAPAAIATLTAGAFVSLGQTGGCAITSGALSCWGQNTYEQLGVLDSGLASSTPVPIALPAGKKAVESALGFGHACAILDDQTVACWGYDLFGQCGVPASSGESLPTPTLVSGVTGATQLALGSYDSCALTAAGAVQCWGYNYEGALGAGPSDGGSYDAPTPLTVLLPSGRKATQIAAGEFSACALLDDGTVACWGFNTYGQLGFVSDGGFGVANTPVLVAGLADVGQIAMGAGSEHVCAKSHGGGVKCWGANASGQLGAATPDSGTGVTMSATPLDVAF